MIVTSQLSVCNVGDKSKEDEDEEQLTPTELEADEEEEEDDCEDEGAKQDEEEPQDSPKKDKDVDHEELFEKEEVNVPENPQNNTDPNQVMTLSLDLDGMVESQWRIDEALNENAGLGYYDASDDISHGKTFKHSSDEAVAPPAGELDSDMEKPKCKRTKKPKHEQIEQNKKTNKDEQVQPGSSKDTKTTNKQKANQNKTQPSKEEQRDEENIPGIVDLESEEDETKGTFKDWMLAACFCPCNHPLTSQDVLQKMPAITCALQC